MRLAAAMKWLETGISQTATQNNISNCEMGELWGRAHIWEEITRTVALDRGVVSVDADALFLNSGYFVGQDRGDYCKWDWELVVIPGPSQAVTADLR